MFSVKKNVDISLLGLYLSASHSTGMSQRVVVFAGRVMKGWNPMGPSKLPVAMLDALPPRQREVTKCILAGKTPKKIAFGMGLSIYTVREHLETIYRKFGVSGRDELMSRFISTSESESNLESVSSDRT
jgi:DNA-binding CsgD family transcriptional regulator